MLNGLRRKADCFEQTWLHELHNSDLTPRACFCLYRHVYTRRASLTTLALLLEGRECIKKHSSRFSWKWTLRTQAHARSVTYTLALCATPSPLQNKLPKDRKSFHPRSCVAPQPEQRHCVHASTAGDTQTPRRSLSLSNAHAPGAAAPWTVLLLKRRQIAELKLADDRYSCPPIRQTWI